MSYTKICKFVVLFTTLLVVCLPLSGCFESSTSSGLSGQTRPAYCLTINELAARLGLVAGQAGNHYYELTNANNTVKLFTYNGDGGRVYVNGTAVGTVGPVQQVGSKIYVPELLVPKIRAVLRTGAPITPWSPSIDTPRLGTGSGIVVIDPGHGGSDPGAQSVLGYWEKDINLGISKRLVDYLRDAGVTVYATRDGDSYPSLEARADLANRKNANLFVSLHCDSNGDRVHKGFTVYIARSASGGSKKAGSLFENSLSNAGIPSKGLRKADYKVLVQTDCPAVLVECGFMSNSDEAALLMSPWYQDKLAKNIASAILDYL